MKKKKVDDSIHYVGDIEKASLNLLNETEKTISEMDSYYPRLLSSSKDEDLKKEVQGRKDSLKRAKKNVLLSYEKLFDLGEELSGRWADIESSYSRKGRKLLAPINAEIDLKEKTKNHFAHGINIYKILWLIFIGSFAGVIIEMAWCFLRHGYIESRQGFVYGPFNLLYGVGAAALTIFLYKYRNHSTWISFVGGFVVGSVLEYICSWGQELIVGSRSWDYSNVPLNINGRICLLYSLFWGVLGVVWIKKIYPIMSELILKIPNKIGKIITWLLVAFFVFDSIVSLLALVRWSERIEYKEPKNKIEIYMDKHFPNERMERIYPNMVFSGDKN